MSQIILTVPQKLAGFVASAEARGVRHRFKGGAEVAPFLTSDPAGYKLGSGGGTVSAVHAAWRIHGKQRSRKLPWEAQGQQIVLHAGGESRRLPAYGAVGKAFIPLPSDCGLKPRLPCPLLADYQLPQLSRTLEQAGGTAKTLVASGDVWLDFDPEEIAPVKTDFTGLGMRVSAEMAQHFGVYFVSKEAGRTSQSHVRPISFFLQKPQPAQIRSLEKRYEFYVDTGIWMLSAGALELLFRRCGWSDRLNCFDTPTGHPSALDLYTEIGCALGTETTAPRKLRRLGFGRLTAGVIPLETARFHHLGSSRQLLESLEELQGHQAPSRRCSTIASQTSHFAPVERVSTWVEASQSAQRIRLLGDNLLTGLPSGAKIDLLRAGACLDVAPVGKTPYVFRPYQIDDSFRGLPGKGGKICGYDAVQWLQARGLAVEGIDVFDLPLYPIAKAEKLSQDWLEWFFAENPDATVGQQIAQSPRISAREVADRVNFRRYFEQRRDGYARELLANFERLIAEGDISVLLQDCAALAAFCRDEAPALREWLAAHQKRILEAIHLPELQGRFLLLLSEMSEANERAALSREGFTRLQTAMVAARELSKVRPLRALKEDQIVWGRSPVRLDLAGGWTDTPPYCLEAGGSVLNVAVLLNGQPPIQVFVRPTSEPCLQLRSIDLGSSETVTTYAGLADFRNPRGHFSLPKAALAMAGFLPAFFEGRSYRTLRAQLAALGGGLEISLLSAVPKGSGLGTSSILAATILGTLNRTCGLGWDELDLYNRVLGVEQLLTTGGGWQDQAGALFPGLKLIETQPGPSQQPSVRYLPTQLFGADIVNHQLLLYYTGITRMAKGILQEIVRDMFLGDSKTLRTLEAIRANARRLFHDLHGGDVQALHRSIARSWKLNKQLDAGTTTPEIERIIATCGSELSSCKLLGAGGGGYMLICAQDNEAGRRLRQKLESNPPNPRARFIDFAISPLGLQVTVS